MGNKTNPKLVPEAPAPEETASPADNVTELHTAEEQLNAAEREELHTAEEQLDAEEREFRALRRDLPGVKGASAAGIVTISVGKAPAKNEFFRTHPDVSSPSCRSSTSKSAWRSTYFAVTSDMIEALAAIGITVTDHVLYLTVTSRGAVQDRAGATSQCRRRAERIHPHQRDRPDPGHAGWVRLYTDLENKATRCFRPRPNASASRNGRT